MNNNTGFFLLTFDLEEFDLPIEYGTKIDEDEMYDISYRGVNSILENLNKLDIKATFFVTGNFALKYPEMILNIYESGHEIASHGLTHSDNYSITKNNKKDILEGKKVLEKIIKNNVIGFRAPRLRHPPFKVLKESGFEYDSSLHPTYIPGRYNNIKSVRYCHKKDGVLEIPISVVPLVRFPFSWIWFRNLGLTYTKICTSISLYDQPIINLYFHPWEFVDIKKYNIPFLLENKTGEWMNKNFRRYLKWCLSKNTNFITIKNYILQFRNLK